MVLIQKPIVDPNAPSCSAGHSHTGGRIVSPIVPSVGFFPPIIIARQRQPPEDKEMEEGTEQQLGLVAIPPALQDEVVVEINAENVA